MFTHTQLGPTLTAFNSTQEFSQLLTWSQCKPFVDTNQDVSDEEI